MFFLHFENNPPPHQTYIKSDNFTSSDDFDLVPEWLGSLSIETMPRMDRQTNDKNQAVPRKHGKVVTKPHNQ